MPNRLCEQPQIAFLPDFDRTQCLQMIGHELAVEQRVPSDPHPGDQPGQRHFRRVRRPRKHAFAEKGVAQRKSI
jgi:hypothetical protein